ncbi:MAG: helix-turn-helix domain-containing protein, partial [Streptococcaceae bacterium]|nr:helix-turn-helix domain-containing protein [Streptococcaceae bacterium]
MLFNELMFEKSVILRIELFKYCTYEVPDVYSVKHFARHLQLNYQQTIGHFRKINDELKRVNPYQKDILRSNGKVDLTNILVGVDEYRYYLLKHSVPFMLLQEIVNGEEMNIEQFCEKYDISRSTISRKLFALTKFLKQYKIRISYSPLSLIGNEAKIRLTLFYIYWIGNKGLEWPFAIEKQRAVEFIQDNPLIVGLTGSFVGELEVHILSGITLSRIDKGHLNEKSASWEKFFDLENKKELVQLVKKYTNNLSEEQVH